MSAPSANPEPEPTETSEIAKTPQEKKAEGIIIGVGLLVMLMLPFLFVWIASQAPPPNQDGTLYKTGVVIEKSVEKAPKVEGRSMTMFLAGKK